MSIKLAKLKSGEIIISDIKEIVSSDKKICAYLFKNPQLIETKRSILLTEESFDSKSNIEVSMTPWIILTSDDEIPVSVDSVVAIVNPIQTIKEMYEEKMNDKDSKVPVAES